MQDFVHICLKMSAAKGEKLKFERNPARNSTKGKFMFYYYKERLIRVAMVLAVTFLLIQAGKSEHTVQAKNPGTYDTTAENVPAEIKTIPEEMSALNEIAGQSISTASYQSILQEYVTIEEQLNPENVESDAQIAVEEELDPEEENEYANLAIAQVTNYVNVRTAPDTDSEIVGKIYNGAVAEVLERAGTEKEWFHITSGSVEGYIKAEFFLYGNAAAEVIDDYVNRSVVVKADRLNVRKEQSTDSGRIGYLDNGEKAQLLENCGEWLKIKYGANKEGYVASEFVTIVEEFTYAKSIEEERAEQEALRKQREREKISETSTPENAVTVVPANTEYSSNAELRDQIVEYSMQFLGNKYVSGGNSLVTGTDCSGFTSLIYAEFGYSIGRTPSSQLSSAGRGIDYSEIQPGDIICYGKSKCTHVALYIGNGQIIHSANSRKGVVIYQADYDNILGVRNVID